jgi:hypothetical protein
MEQAHVDTRFARDLRHYGARLLDRPQQAAPSPPTTNDGDAQPM